VPKLVTVLRSVVRETLRLPEGIGFGVIVGVDDVYDETLPVLADDKEVREEASPDIAVAPRDAEPTLAFAVSQPADCVHLGGLWDDAVGFPAVAIRAERARIAAVPIERDSVDDEQALEWLASLGTLWRATSDDGRRRLAVTAFVRLGVRSGPDRGSHRIVTVETTREADRRGLVLALPTSLEVTMVGDTGFEPVTSRM
jgi:hypothetical protein